MFCCTEEAVYNSPCHFVRKRQHSIGGHNTATWMVQGPHPSAKCAILMNTHIQQLHDVGDSFCPSVTQSNDVFAIPLKWRSQHFCPVTTFLVIVILTHWGQGSNFSLFYVLFFKNKLWWLPKISKLSPMWKDESVSFSVFFMTLWWHLDKTLLPLCQRPNDINYMYDLPFFLFQKHLLAEAPLKTQRSFIYKYEHIVAVAIGSKCYIGYLCLF